ncbi:hypothetical protein COT30_05100 [Candidatus Micrarchaeota archaeon CG08_land_8_20_14_0_20_49_17]|nr:MAG: hypothetical protein AUJ13_04640 [Candidatus Micrarchaeota archaeon CG1_02_49_24]PIU09304.1 MAG: hypothetical protein COT30_05100 [Candidatus Micrarchaeota archaeon CG08_land_8_20_14_0_20_49_17]PIZ97693.1 MAG: hypothetical protein COX84_02925 [Candidatus Micrarchaeota archaeon CG_4_10_14_0_2_um_filter_49_7]HII53922.1 hypothetical protein [Candidatus Micrarchaeota archaeon]
MVRNPIVAVIMGIIPLVNIYLLYKWWGELNDAGAKKHDPMIYTVLFLIPVVNLYALYELLSTADELGRKNKAGGYALGVIPLIIVSIILMGIPLLYVLYKTQQILNESG